MTPTAPAPNPAVLEPAHHSDRLGPTRGDVGVAKAPNRASRKRPVRRHSAHHESAAGRRGDGACAPPRAAARGAIAANTAVPPQRKRTPRLTASSCPPPVATADARCPVRPRQRRRRQTRGVARRRGRNGRRRPRSEVKRGERWQLLRHEQLICHGELAKYGEFSAIEISIVLASFAWLCWLSLYPARRSFERGDGEAQRPALVAPA